MTTEGKREHSTPSLAGMTLIIVGFLLLLDRLGVLDFGDFVQTFWPLILIWFGVRMIFFPKKQEESPAVHAAVESTGEVLEGGLLYERKVLGDIRRDLNMKNFPGAKFMVTFGDIDIDAREIGLESGQHTLYASTVFGDIRLRLPKEVPYLVRGNVSAGELDVAGEHASGVFVQRSLKSVDFDGASTRLIIVASAVFGDIQIW